MILPGSSDGERKERGRGGSCSQRVRAQSSLPTHTMESRRSKPGRSASGSKDDRRPAQPGLSSQGGHTASKRLAKGKGKAREDTSTLASKFVRRGSAYARRMEGLTAVL